MDVEIIRQNTDSDDATAIIFLQKNNGNIVDALIEIQYSKIKGADPNISIYEKAIIINRRRQQNVDTLFD